METQTDPNWAVPSRAEPYCTMQWKSAIGVLVSADVQSCRSCRGCRGAGVCHVTLFLSRAWTDGKIKGAFTPDANEANKSCYSPGTHIQPRLFCPPLLFRIVFGASAWLVNATRISAKVQIFQLARITPQTLNSRCVIRATSFARMIFMILTSCLFHLHYPLLTK